LTELIIYTLLKYLLLDFYQFFNIEVIPPFVNDNNYIVQGIWRAIYFLGLSTGYWFAVSTINNRKKIADLENAQLKNELENQALEKALLTTENAYLKSQINPHFLLNTLNFLYNSVSKFSDTIADSVMTLADIMRYALTNADEDGKVKLEMELDHIANFISLNQARFSQKLCIDMIVEGDTDGLRIIPLVLITLVENIFKYGDLQNADNPARIMAKIEGNALTFITQNLKKKRVTEPGYGIGVQNIKNRLSAYHQYDLTIEDSEQYYKSTLLIQL
jgi:LytS/YehU family sensor histidine kinase